MEAIHRQEKYWKRWVDKRDKFECDPKTKIKRLSEIYLSLRDSVGKNRQLSFYLDTACKFVRDAETGIIDYSRNICDFKLADKAIKDGADINGEIAVDDCPAYMGDRNFDQMRKKEVF